MLSHCNISRISIHAPAKGATKRGRLRTSAPFISIHAPAKGATNIYRFAIVKGTFQSTLPRRERRNWLRLQGRWIRYFNPRSREGSDDVRVFSPEPGIVISIHAPAKGATVTTPENCMLLQAISIHAPAKGATPK